MVDVRLGKGEVGRILHVPFLLRFGCSLRALGQSQALSSDPWPMKLDRSAKKVFHSVCEGTTTFYIVRSSALCDEYGFRP